MSPRPAPIAPSLALALLLLAVASPAQAAEATMEAPGDFRNGQDNPFGSIAMVPYLSASDGPVPIEARIVLRDLETLGAAADVLVAFNVKGDAVRATLGSLRTADGKALVPLRTATVDHGRQPQAHFAPADLLAAAQDGRIDLVLEGSVEPSVDSQSHVGAMVIAFDEAWGTLPSGDGPAQLYGFTMVGVAGAGGGAMPFQGQGNTWAVLPLALVAFVVAVAGTLAVSMLSNQPPAPVLAAAPTVPGVPPTSVPTFGRTSATPTFGGPVPVPVFGGPAPPAPAVARPAGPIRPAQAVAPAATTAATSTSAAVRVPMQGPILPPGPLDRSPVFGAPAANAAPAKPLAEARASVPARPPRPSPTSSRAPPAKAATGAVLTAAKRPKAKPSAKAPPPTRRPRVSGESSR